MKNLLILALLLTGCSSGVPGSGVIKSEPRKLGPCTQLQVEGVYQVAITAGAPTPSLTVEADDNLLPLIQTELTGDKLWIHSQQSLRPSKPMRISLSVPSLSFVSCAGACDLKLTELHNDSLTVECSGAGKLGFSGETHKLAVTISGAGDLDAQNLKAEQVKLSLSGSAQAAVFASSELDVSISGAGRVDYYGRPATVKKTISGAGTLNPK